MFAGVPSDQFSIDSTFRRFEKIKEQRVRGIRLFTSAANHGRKLHHSSRCAILEEEPWLRSYFTALRNILYNNQSYTCTCHLFCIRNSNEDQFQLALIMLRRHRSSLRPSSIDSRWQTHALASATANCHGALLQLTHGYMLFLWGGLCHSLLIENGLFLIIASVTLQYPSRLNLAGLLSVSL